MVNHRAGDSPVVLIADLTDAEVTEAAFTIDCANAQILASNTAAQELLNLSPEAIAGEPWPLVLKGDDSTSEIVTSALLAGARVSLPPILLRRADGTEIVVGGSVLRCTETHSQACCLLLWPLLFEDQEQALHTLSEFDTVALFGVDHLQYGSDWGAGQTGQLVSRISAQLAEIVRTQDSVGEPQGPAVSVVLRDVGMTGAADICRALLSHLHASVGKLGRARICVGLARREPHCSALSTLLAANRALQQAQMSGAHEPIRAAGASDKELVLGQMLGTAGFFSGSTPAYESIANALEVDATSPQLAPAPPLAPIETNIEGYVVDNMEGAVDQAIFLARLDVPIAIVGSAGTGKMYVARVIHDETGAAPEMLISIDCREFRNRGAATARIAKELSRGEGKTLVFKSPHLMHADVQQKLARQISSRRLADVTPARYLPQMKLIALFPDELEVLIRKGGLIAPLASAFAGYPIRIPPIKDRKQAVLRWAHKILGQEGALRDRRMQGFTPDAERAMLLYDWPGNISEMRQCIYDALEKTDKDWLTPVDLGLFEGINPDGAPQLPQSTAFLEIVQETAQSRNVYEPSAAENLDVVLGAAIHDMLSLNLLKPLGSWLEDDLVLACLDRYRNDVPKAASFLHTSARNVRRWMPKIEAREDERNSSSLWHEPRRLLREWVRESPQPEISPLVMMQDKLMVHLGRQAGALSSAKRARVMGISTPTYLKRMRELEY